MSQKPNVPSSSVVEYKLKVTADWLKNIAFEIQMCLLPAEEKQCAREWSVVTLYDFWYAEKQLNLVVFKINYSYLVKFMDYFYKINASNFVTKLNFVQGLDHLKWKKTHVYYIYMLYST